jgi:hypothetical protein
MEQQTVYDLAEKHDSSLDLIEKNLGKNDLVYELTEIDTWPEVCSATPPLASAKSAKSNRASADIFSTDCRNIPKSRRSIGRCGQHSLAIRTELRRSNPVVMLHRLADCFAGCRIPEPRRVIR